MSVPATLPLELPTSGSSEKPRGKRVRRAAAGERRRGVTSFAFKTLGEERALEALMDEYGVTSIGEAVRLALRDAAATRGIDVDKLDEELATAA